MGLSLFLNTKIVNNGKLSAAGDFCLAPCRALFHGKTVELIDSSTKEHSSFEKVSVIQKIVFSILLPFGIVFGSILKGSALLFASTRKGCRQVKIHRDHKKEFANQLDKLKSKLESGETIAHPDVVNHQFPEIDKLCSILRKEQREDRKDLDLDLLINRAFVQQQIRNPKAFQPDPIEVAVFRELGCDIMKIPIDKKLMHAKIALMLKVTLSRADFADHSFQAIKKKIDHLAFVERWVTAGGAREDAEKVADLIRAARQVKKLIQQAADQVYKDAEAQLNGDEKLQKFDKVKTQILKSVKGHLRREQREGFRFFIEYSLRQHPISLENYQQQVQQDAENFLPVIKATILEKWNTDIRHIIDSKRAWYDKWSHYLVKEMIQGLDDAQEVFHEGVCYGIVHDISVKDQKHPDWSADRLAQEVYVSPVHRFYQAFYQIEKADKCLKEIFLAEGDKNWQQDLDQHQKNLQDKTNGVCRLGIYGKERSKEIKGEMEIWGHAVYLRIDTQKNKYYVFDPNIGLVALNNSDETKECMQDVIDTYPKVIGVKGKINRQQ